ncbi:thiamine phosphate synthase [Diaphorobacter sp. HDW4A]|uniref:thiamine phosphate synthase n=1 Tax=Diaphorobacter sp. HDW4A TaxID=2714924 RepID=UPI00140BCE56|nr:thiamine phosphate synthase [Diaphorobacter sp. HDW4A]QIL80474.1 thiamine phosphate synthase [Diaphorobacter sp. HDW4A]
MQNDLTVDAMKQAILAAHASAFADFPAQPEPAPAINNNIDDPVYRAALATCSQLGFIGHDADCVANAWKTQTARTGHFDAAAWPVEPADFGLQPVPHAQPFAACPKNLGLYAVLPDAAMVGRMARAGVPTVQLRFKSTDPAAIEAEVKACVEAVRGTDAHLYINDHWRIAIAAGSYGVHLGQEDLDALTQEEISTLRDSGVRLGVSTHGYAEMVRADAVAPSYIAMGAVFPTTLKKMATVPQGIARLEQYAKLMCHYPQVAIGGIGLDQFPQILATGVRSIAVVRAIVNAADPEKAAAELMHAMGS